MERDDRPSVVRLFADADLRVGDMVVEGQSAQHARVRRVQTGDAIQLLDGRGHIADAIVTSVGKDRLDVSVSALREVPVPSPLEVVAPIADKDRMLLAAEKCVELQITEWRPALFARSRSVSSRGEGEKFRAKVIGRMQAALEQSGGAWLPTVHDDRDGKDVLAHTSPTSHRILLDAPAAPLATRMSASPIVIAVGPEGGFERVERELATQAGWISASISTAILRFETALIAGVAVVRSAQLGARS